MTPAPVAVQAPAPPLLALSLTAGPVGFSRLQVQPVLAERTDDLGEPVEDWNAWRSLSASSGWELDLSGLVSLGPVWALRIGVGIARARLDVDYGGVADALLDEIDALPGPAGGRLSLLSGDAALRFRVPVSGRLRPFVELGAVAERWSVEPDDGPLPPAVEEEDVARFGGRAGVGVEFPLIDRVEGQVQLSTRLFRTPLETGSVGAPLEANDSLRLTLMAPATAPWSDGSVELARLLRLDLGLTLRLMDL